jgi:hypothetical protein
VHATPWASHCLTPSMHYDWPRTETGKEPSALTRPVPHAGHKVCSMSMQLSSKV